MPISIESMFKITLIKTALCIKRGGSLNAQTT